MFGSGAKRKAEAQLAEWLAHPQEFGGTETWSFVGDEVNAIADDALIQAYCGWSGLFPALQAGRILTTFEPDGEEARFLAQKQAEGLTDVAIITRYKIGTSELFEFTAVFDGKPAKGAGNTGDEVGFLADDACYGLPPIYFLLGRFAIKAMR